MLVSNANTICPRLLDYFAIVGCQNAAKNIDCLQDPQILRCYPQDSHSDFELPKEVVYFCQPEGCVSGSVSSLNVDRTSFVFTLTEKDSGTVRFGISLNFYRTCSDPTDCIEENHSTVNSNCQNNAMDPENYAQKTALTSLCIISHYPFFSKFRECLHMIEHILEAGNNFFNEIQASSRTKWTLWDLFVGKVDPNTIEHPSPIIDLFHEIEFWILRLLSTPAPLPGKSCIQLSAVPEWYRTNPLVFALPDKTRLSLIDFPLHLPLELLGVETCLKVLTAIMLERKVILQSRDYNALTMSVMAFSALLYPLQYMFPAIPLLPNSLAGAENLLLSPTPYLIGIPATFLNQKKGFLIPSDVWLVDLDTNRMMGSKNIEPITPMPPLEGKELVEHLEQALSRMHSAQTTNANSETPAVGGMEPEKIIHEASDDVDVVDVATRVAMVQFFNSPNVLANLSEHTRTVRLYPRPVVAFQYYSFLKSRQDLTPFIRQLAKTQVCLNDVYSLTQSRVCFPTYKE
ncbi:putative Map-kinase activating death domain protein [Fasciola hepatica]|uniref:MAP kinase-activating death domain protein n=1 Tax=Fasciola hepatica TaxID=6192 RepID=A0A4E0R284_FASHE|nr:putative Map-kinase activating death domain protein [Fasciola hepatica]